MRSVDEQLDMIIDATMAPEPIRIGITDALGLMCAEEVQASSPLPGFSQAAVDGYAVRAVDAGGGQTLGKKEGPAAAETETSLPVVGEVAAGSQKPLRLQPRQAVRVATGAPLPTLADAVLPLEWSDRGRKRVSRTVRCALVISSVRKATTSNPVTWLCALVPCSAQRRLACWLPPAAIRCWCTRVRV